MGASTLNFWRSTGFLGGVFDTLSTERIDDSNFEGIPKFLELAQAAVSLFPELRRYEGDKFCETILVLCTRKYGKIRATRDLLIFTGAKEAIYVIITPVRYWLKRGTKQSIGATSRITITPFVHHYTTEKPEADDTVISETWEHTTKDGQPDRRWMDNPKVYVVRRYGIALKLENGFRWRFGELNRPQCAALTTIMLEISGTHVETRAQINDLLGTAERIFIDSQIESASQGSSEKNEGLGEETVRVRKQPWFKVLGVDRNATIEEIKAAWHELMMQYHPDRGQGLAPEIRSHMAATAQALNDAYREAIKLRR